MESRDLRCWVKVGVILVASDKLPVRCNYIVPPCMLNIEECSGGCACVRREAAQVDIKMLLCRN